MKVHREQAHLLCEWRIVCQSCHLSNQKLQADDSSHEPLRVNASPIVRVLAHYLQRLLFSWLFVFRCVESAVDNSACGIFRLIPLPLVSLLKFLLPGAPLLSLKNVKTQELGCLTPNGFHTTQFEGPWGVKFDCCEWTQVCAAVSKFMCRAFCFVWLLLQSTESTFCGARYTISIPQNMGELRKLHSTDGVALVYKWKFNLHFFRCICVQMQGLWNFI